MRGSPRLGALSLMAIAMFASCGDDDGTADGAGPPGGSAASSTGATAGSGAEGGAAAGGGNAEGGVGGGPDLPADPIVLDDFSDLRTTAVLPNPENPPQPLWYPQFQASDPQVDGGILSVTAEGAPQIYFRPTNNDGWFFLRALVESGEWSDSGFNRLRFHVKQPDGLEVTSAGQHNVEWASFLHVGSATDGPWSGSDDENWHFYHFLDIPSDGLWYHVVIDTYPDHQRNEGGSVEQGDQEFPEGGGAFNYFSMMTSFYYDLPGASASGAVQFKQFSLFYEDNATVPLAQVRSINGAFDPATQTIKLGWMRRKDQSGQAYDVAWSYDAITDFEAATPAGRVVAPDTDDYNGVHFAFSEPELAEHDVVHVAIRPSGSELFRQLWIALN